MLTRRLFQLLAICGLLLRWPAATLAADYVNESRTITGSPQSATERFSFTLGKDDPYPYLELTVQMSQGRADMQICDPAGQVLETLGGQECAIQSRPISGATGRGAYTLAIGISGAVGQWHVRVSGGPTPSPPPSSVGPGLFSASAMLLVAIASVWLCRRRTAAPWRWFWVGAALWTVAVVAKFVLFGPLHEPLHNWLKSSLPNWAYLTVGSIYGGALTGVTEILFVFIAALIWRRMAATAPRALAIGVGAGAFEAALLALVAAAGVLSGTMGGLTWSMTLLPVVERANVILCHAASRMLVLRAVAGRRWMLFGYGFLLLSATDVVGAYMWLTGLVSSSPWVLEVILLPFGLISIPIIFWSYGHWPSTMQPAAREKETPQAAVV